ncbi:uncharacterized protein [Euwallacea similis]|uniref:uncharacterized protein n=1 Tax=Euwallacea similis TaxID=1736056 RepID=UPI00344D50E4
MVKSLKKVNTKSPKDPPSVKKLSKASSKTSAGTSSTPVKGTKKRPLSTKPVVKKKTLLNDNSMCSEDLPTFNTEPIRKKQKLTKTFEKYGVIVPSLEEILVEQEQIREYKEQVQRAMKLKKLNFTALTILTNVRRSERISDQVSKAIPLDCKHLALEKITWYFNKYMPVRKIINRKFTSRRQKQYYFKKNGISQNGPYLDLEYSSTSMVFTFEQVDHMANLMKNRFESENINIQYLCQILISELCFKIFMDVHNMDRQQAKTFFDKCPFI